MASALTIGERIRQERLARDMTQRELADMVKVGVPHISKVEAGRENPSDELLERIASVFKLDSAELMLVARRLPADMLDEMAAQPELALEHLRSWKGKSS